MTKLLDSLELLSPESTKPFLAVLLKTSGEGVPHYYKDIK